MIPVIVILAYLAVIAVIGSIAFRRSRENTEDFFLASRSIGSLVFFLSLFATNMTAFAIVGSSGAAYRQGIGIYGLMASSSCFGHSADDLFHRHPPLGAGQEIWPSNAGLLFSRSLGMQPHRHGHFRPQRGHARAVHDYQHHGRRHRPGRTSPPRPAPHSRSFPTPGLRRRRRRRHA